MDLRPMTISELLDRTFFFYRKHFLVFVGIIAIPMLVWLLVSVVTIVIQSPLPANSTARSLLEFIPIITLILISFFAQGATIAAVSDVYLERPLSVGNSYARLRGNLLSLLLALIFLIVTTMFGFILCIVPGIIFALAFILTIPAVVVENMTPMDAMSRSWELTKESRGRIFLILIIVGCLAGVINGIFQLPGIIMSIIAGALSRAGNPTNLMMPAQIVTIVGSFFASCLTTPLSAIATSLIYYDQRVRKEGFDLQLMLSALESRGNETPRQEIF